MYDRLTQSDIDKMQAEIDHRKLVVRPQILQEVREARAQGDLSENFEYHAARREKNQNESRIAYPEDMIATAIIIDDDDSVIIEGDGASISAEHWVLHSDDDAFDDVALFDFSVRNGLLDGA